MGQRVSGVMNLGAAVFATTLLGMCLVAPTARASYIVTLLQLGNSVSATGHGTIDTADLGSAGPAPTMDFLLPSAAAIITGTASAAIESFSVQANGPSMFGPGGPSNPSSGGGDAAGIFGSVFVPYGYVSDNTLASTSTYAGQTFVSLGLTPGTYVYSFGSGADADTFTVQVGPTAISEPPSLALIALGLLALVAVHPRLYRGHHAMIPG